MKFAALVPVLLLVTAAVACESKEAAVLDAGPAPSVALPIPSALASTDTAAVIEETAPVAAAAAAAAGGTAAKGTAAATADASAAVVTLDAGAAGQECCCEASGFALQSVAMSECNKTRKGQCVAKTKCASAAPAASVTPAPAATPDAGAGQTCCCDAAGTKSVTGMSACTKGGKGKCVKASECK